MKKIGVLFGIMFMLSIFSFSFATAEACDLGITMINQDPYPAIPGDEAKVVFQINGASNPECKTVEFGLIEKYPVTISPGEEKIYTFQSGTFVKDYKSFFLAPFKIKVAPDSVDGDNIIEVKYRSGDNEGYETKQFNLNVKDSRAKFEVNVKDYDIKTNMITFEVLNIAENDIKALAVEVPKQDNIIIKGSNREIVGDLDSDEYTTADFEAIPVNGKLKLLLKYSDENNERRSVEEDVEYDNNYFVDRLKDKKKSPTGNYITFGIIILLIVLWYRNKQKKKKVLQEKLKNRK